MHKVQKPLNRCISLKRFSNQILKPIGDVAVVLEAKSSKRFDVLIPKQSIGCEKKKTKKTKKISSVLSIEITPRVIEQATDISFDVLKNGNSLITSTGPLQFLKEQEFVSAEFPLAYSLVDEKLDRSKDNVYTLNLINSSTKDLAIGTFGFIVQVTGSGLKAYANQNYTIPTLLDPGYQITVPLDTRKAKDKNVLLQVSAATVVTNGSLLEFDITYRGKSIINGQRELARAEGDGFYPVYWSTTHVPDGSDEDDYRLVLSNTGTGAVSTPYYTFSALVATKPSKVLIDSLTSYPKEPKTIPGNSTVGFALGGFRGSGQSVVGINLAVDLPAGSNTILYDVRRGGKSITNGRQVLFNSVSTSSNVLELNTVVNGPSGDDYAVDLINLTSKPIGVRYSSLTIVSQ